LLKIPQFSLSAVDKSQVFALRLNRREFSKNSSGSIRRKFSIDAGKERAEPIFLATSTISKPYRLHAGNPAFTIRID